MSNHALSVSQENSGGGEERRVRSEEGPCFRDKENLGLHWEQEHTGPQGGCREASAAGGTGASAGMFPGSCWPEWAGPPA